MRLLLVIVSAVGCTPMAEPTGDIATDAALPADARVDMAIVDQWAQHDLSRSADLSASPTDGSVRACTSVLGINTKKFVINAVTLPTTFGATAFKYDLDGDGRSENQYANIVTAFQAGFGTFDQSAFQATVSSGNNIMLIQAASSDPTFQSDPCAGSDFHRGLSQASPNFTGAGSFTIDSGVPVGPFKGPLSGAAFDSNTPATTTAPVSIQVVLAFNGAMVPVPLIGAHMKWTYEGGLTSGQLNGAIHNTDMQNTVIPAIVTSFNADITGNPTSVRSGSLLTLFDTGGAPDTSGTCATSCRNPNGTCAVAGNGVIEVCEFSTNSIIVNLLAPDLDMFADDGSYMPNPGGYPAGVDMSGTPPKNDSISVGFGFTAVGVAF
jgi:hypothetical protein